MTSGPLSVEYSNAARLGARRRERLITELDELRRDGFPAGFDLSVVDHTGVVLRAWGGNACVVGETVPIDRDTLYDLASLTKVIATTTLVLALADAGRWRLDDRVARWLPGFPRDDLTMRHLLTHTSGLVPHRPFFHLGRDPRAIRRALYDEAAHGDAPGSVLYSDLNFILLGWALTRLTGTPLHRLFRDLIAGPLGLTSTGYRPPLRQRRRVAATELNGDQRLTPQLVWGEVHDGNAWALGGVAGHAGLFSTASDLQLFTSALLTRRHPVLRPSTIRSMSHFQAGAQPDVRGLGWRLDPRGWGAWPTGTYWHTGFTGTSLLVAPALDAGVVLLTNAIHPIRQLDRQAQVRATLHRTLAGALA